MPVWISLTLPRFWWAQKRRLRAEPSAIDGMICGLTPRPY